jgi:hypothetical protein
MRRRYPRRMVSGVAIVAVSLRRFRVSGGASAASRRLGIGEVEPVATELGVEDAVFREEVGDDLWLVALEPVSNHGHQELEDHRRSSAWRL